MTEEFTFDVSSDEIVNFTLSTGAGAFAPLGFSSSLAGVE